MYEISTRNGEAVVNIKKHLWPEQLTEALEEEPDYDPAFRTWFQWAHNQHKLWEPGGLLWFAEDQARAELVNDAVDLANDFFGCQNRCWQDGCSGGWLVVAGLTVHGEIEDAETFRLWLEFEKRIEEMRRSKDLAFLTLRIAHDIWEHHWLDALERAL